MGKITVEDIATLDVFSSYKIILFAIFLYYTSRGLS